MILIQYLLPHHLLSRMVYGATRCRWRPWKNFLIRAFMWRYTVRMDEAERPGIEEYTSFNDFFTRPLKRGVRPIAGDGALVSPVDGVVSRVGGLDGDQIIQAKGKWFNVEDLLAGTEDECAPFRNGCFATLYLAPSEYHRVHMPLDGSLKRMSYIPGALFSVNNAATGRIPGLFARNERIVCWFDTACGPMILCMVGALFVGSMETVWHGQVTPVRPRIGAVYSYDGPLFSKGAEIGRFNMGSTVILLFSGNVIKWDMAVQADSTVRVGGRIGSLTPAGPALQPGPDATYRVPTRTMT